MKKLLCLMLALAMFATMSVTAFANSYTTTVTYDITDGNAIVTTTGTAVEGSEVTQILYTGADYETGNILYIDQTTAGADGNFGLTYKVKGSDIAALNSMTSIVGTDDGVINFAETSDNIGDISLADRITITVENTDLYKDITVALASDLETAVTVARGTQKNIVANAGAELAFNVGTTNYEYTVDGGSALTDGATFNKTFNATSTIAFGTKTVAIDMDAWIAGEGAYEDVMVWDVVASLADFNAGEGSYVSGDEGLLDDLTSAAKELSVLSKISNATGDIEYGIMFVVGSVGELNENTSKVKILNTLGATEGVWAIKAIDKVGETLTTNATVCTYVKYNGTYRCGEPIVVNYAE